jgi:hypothetical protein
MFKPGDRVICIDASFFRLVGREAIVQDESWLWRTLNEYEKEKGFVPVRFVDYNYAYNDNNLDSLDFHTVLADKLKLVVSRTRKWRV